ncbi:MAG TPA: hypothetical protein VM286_00420 [Candidatus Thermoplasmatota archaeon]|nr:hypothetical protein [Candidatus Thermoplasmatota archaeon]
MTGPSAGLRVALLSVSACVLFLAVATAGTATQPYAPNDWAFSHVLLADRALASGHLPLNQDVLSNGDFAANHGAFLADTHLHLLTFYASTVWHFWNGLPLHPSLVATLAAGTGLSPEDTMRLPLGGMVLVLLVHASATLILGRMQGTDPRLAAAAPFLLAAACAPFALDMRVLMPSVTLVLLGVMLHAMLRRLFLQDRAALAWGLLPLVLLPFWYYTVSYFVILLLLGFVAADVALRLRYGRQRPVLVPAWAALAICAVLGVALLANSALTSHLKLASQMSGSWIAPDAGSDYTTHLNRQAWRSALLYTGIALLFAPLVAGGALAARDFLRRRPLGHAAAVFALWGVGGTLFSVALESTVGVSFLNRTVIYLAPLGALAASILLSRVWGRRTLRAAAIVACAALLVLTTALVATATPRYVADDARAYEWVGRSVPPLGVVYAPLEVGSALFRQHGIVNMLAFYPRVSVLEDVWYGHDAERLVPYLASFDYLVVRHEVTRGGFEEFGPLRQPIDAQAYAKFAASRDLALVYQNGEVDVYRVMLRDGPTTGDGGSGAPGLPPSGGGTPAS